MQAQYRLVSILQRIRQDVATLLDKEAINAACQEVQTPRGPRGPDTHDPRDPRETRRIEIVPRGWSFSIRCLTRQVDLILLTSTVIVDMISVMNARRCFRSVTDAHIRPAPDRR
jgi:hypothetical protein